MVQPEIPTRCDKVDAATMSVVDRLERWQQFGGVWRVTFRNPDSVTISFCRCDAGEEVDRLTSDNPEVREWLSNRTSSEDGEIL